MTQGLSDSMVEIVLVLVSPFQGRGRGRSRSKRSQRTYRVPEAMSAFAPSEKPSFHHFYSAVGKSFLLLVTRDPIRPFGGGY